MRIKITENFFLHEFTKLTSILPLQMYMMQRLCETLEVIRFICSSRIKIRSGMRTYEDFIRLQQQGFHPSETSDHFFGSPIPLSNAKKVERYGRYYPYSVGAADIETLDIKTEDAFLKIIENRDKVHTGQIILEKHNTYWIHISNHQDIIYNKYVCNTFLKKDPNLISLDKGVTFHNAIEWINQRK